MKKLLVLALLAAGSFSLSSCSVAEGLAKAIGRTGNSVGRSVGNLGGALGN